MASRRPIPSLIAEFPVTTMDFVKGSRRLAREKVLQILAACETSGIDWQSIYTHVIMREFSFNPEEERGKPEKLMTPAEIDEFEADTAIRWEQDEVEFIRTLLIASYDVRAYADPLVEKYSQNWDYDRIAILDRILLRMAIAELITFPEIPVKVTVNETLEIAKLYSTDRSNAFINGIMDSVIEEMTKEGKFQKTGRGLL
ncbi:MAG: transcription antitermination factor NusB [Candidatus Kapabacteria bacterium]|jgi:transcription antitermination factor NusB|nr:transcription antitermination factor NusB [Candidatus Kapabacteria bacterium]